MAEVIESKESKNIIKVMEKWIDHGVKPEELISDNGKEFTSKEFREFCCINKIAHTKVSVEAHGSNGRVERLISTVREGLVKNEIEPLEIKINKIIMAYNNTYHSAIQMTPKEACLDESGMAIVQNSLEGSYASKFKRSKIEQIEVGQLVRIAKRENITVNQKRKKGRFLGTGKIIEKCPGNSYLVMTDSGRIMKKRYYDLKIKRSLVDNEEHEG